MELSWNDVKNKVYNIAPVGMHAAFLGVSGYYVGLGINLADRWLHPVKNALGKPPLLNPLHGAICGVAFCVIDHFAYNFAQRLFKNNRITNAPRVIVSITLTALLVSTVFSISLSMAGVITTTNFLATGILRSIADSSTKSMHGNVPVEDKKPETKLRRPDADYTKP